MVIKNKTRPIPKETVNLLRSYIKSGKVANTLNLYIRLDLGDKSSMRFMMMLHKAIGTKVNKLFFRESSKNIETAKALKQIAKESKRNPTVGRQFIQLLKAIKNPLLIGEILSFAGLNEGKTRGKNLSKMLLNGGKNSGVDLAWFLHKNPITIVKALSQNDVNFLRYREPFKQAL